MPRGWNAPEPLHVPCEVLGLLPEGDPVGPPPRLAQGARLLKPEGVLVPRGDGTFTLVMAHEQQQNGGQEDRQQQG